MININSTFKRTYTELSGDLAHMFPHYDETQGAKPPSAFSLIWKTDAGLIESGDESPLDDHYDDYWDGDDR